METGRKTLDGSQSPGTLHGYAAGLHVGGESPCVSLEAEIPEVLYQGMKAFIGSNPAWDQYQVMSSALAQFLFQNGCSERAVTERYLDDLFSRSEV